jgi:hypothetical protein
MACRGQSVDHGRVSSSVLRPPSGREVTSPTAIRARRPSWRDPRLAVGLALVCISVVVGARVLASADDTVAVLAASGDLVAGQPVTAEELTEVRIRFTSEQDADRYLAAGDELPDGAVLLRPVGSGELVPRGAVSTEAGGLVEVPLSLDPGRVPASVRPGSVVDVWVGSDGEGGRRSDLLLSEVPVLSVSRAGGLGAGGLRQVVVGIPSDEESEVDDVIGRLNRSLVVVRRPG